MCFFSNFGLILIWYLTGYVIRYAIKFTTYVSRFGRCIRLLFTKNIRYHRCGRNVPQVQCVVVCCHWFVIFYHAHDSDTDVHAQSVDDAETKETNVSQNPSLGAIHWHMVFCDVKQIHVV